MAIQYNASSFLGMINDGYKYMTHYQKNVREVNTDVEELEDKLTDFRKSVRKLNTYSSKSTTNENLEKQLKEFVETYNSVKDGSEEITDKKLSKSFKKMELLIEDHKKELKNLGIRENTKGEIIFDEEKFEEVKIKDIEKLFEGKDSFVRNIFRLTKTIQKQAEEAKYDIVNRRFSSQIPFESEKVALATDALDITVGITKCESMNTLIESGTLTDEQKAVAQSNLTTFVGDYNTLLGYGAEDTNIKAIIEKTVTYKNELSTIGITIDESSNRLTYTETDSIDANAYNALFGDASNSYGNVLAQYAHKIYTAALDTDSHGISIDMQL